ncbi:MAG: hypothetical protein IT374_04360 [Polyangiaceae bacterium]|nr:hypothetical protein [Polyangiaceae bacterium]
MTPLDRRLLVDTALGSTALAALAWAVMSLVDEPWMTLGDRAARVAALTPLLGALSAWLVAARAARRGELAALSLAGVGRARALLGAWLGALPVSVLASLAVASGRVPVAALFPRAPGAGLTPTVDGFSHASVIVGAAGPTWRDAASAVDGHASPVALAASLLALAPALGWLALRPWTAALGGACGASVTAAALVGFHAAARPGGAPWLLLSPAVALAWAAWPVAVRRAASSR